MNYIDQIAELGSCRVVLQWLRGKNFQTLSAAWRCCPYGDWMLWLAARAGLTPERHRALVLAACDCADIVAEYRRPGDKKVLKAALATARAWAHGEATLNEVAEAVAKAEAAVAAAWLDEKAKVEEAKAAKSVAKAVLAVRIPTEAWVAAEAAAETVWAATPADEAAAAEEDILHRCAYIVRKYLTAPTLERGVSYDKTFLSVG